LFGRVDYDLKNNIQMLILTGFIDFDWVGPIYFKLRGIASIWEMQILTYHTVQQF
jgi:hypothetical protein